MFTLKIKRHSVNSKLLLYMVSKRNEFTKPEYPKILDLTYEKTLHRKKESEWNAIKAVNTTEEKQIKLNMPKYYGFKCYMLKENNIPYNNLNLIQHVTRTHLIINDELPEYFNKFDVDNVLEKLQENIQESIIFELDKNRRMHNLKKQMDKIEKENFVGLILSKTINRLIINYLSRKYRHLKEVQIDVNSRIESFWLAGGMKPPENIKRYRLGQVWQKKSASEPSNRAMHYMGTADIALRSEQPLPPIISHAESENSNFDIASFDVDPRTVGIAAEHRHLANVPGFWPGDNKQFGTLSYHQRGHFSNRDYNDPEESKEAIHRQGILGSFGWLNAQANFLGFNTYNEITYPLVTQSIITNGKFWSFYVYQLNTLLTHSHYTKENPKHNICWATPEYKLFEKIDGSKLVGFNKDTLKHLIKFYMNKPESRVGVNLMPYLDQTIVRTADYEEDDKRKWLEKEYKFIVSNRPRAHLNYEIYSWEKIYKIDHETRFMEKRRRPFELMYKPSDRTLDDRKPKYIPRVLRADLPRHKGRNAKEYFP